MAKVRKLASSRGTQITGKKLKADGSPDVEAFTITPHHAGTYQGIFYTRGSIQVQPGPTGDFSVVLPPSSVLGPYEVQFSQSSLSINVPDSTQVVEFTTIIA